MKFPISVIIPTLNCRDKLDRHLELSEEWLPYVEEIIAIDSTSNDGTRELLDKRLKIYNAQIISTEPGLYKAWNLGVSKATQPYVYYSTICDIITLAGIRGLYNIAEKNCADLVISTPTMVDAHFEKIEPFKKWPIHYLENFLNSKGGEYVPSKHELELFCLAFIPESIIGSSASNLYRSDVLRRCKFPEDVGNPGDVYWAIRYIPHLKTIITSNRFAGFSFDNASNRTWTDVQTICTHMHEIENEANVKALDNQELFYGIIDQLQGRNKYLMNICSQYIDRKSSLSNQHPDNLRDKVLTYTSARYWVNRLKSGIFR